MLETCEEGKSVIFISSELDEIIRCSNRIIVMRDMSKAAELDGDTQQAEILKIIASEDEKEVSA
jgi:simple sugar transport system ATP-binding protein